MEEKNAFEKLNKLSMPATILIASIILGGFYYFSEVNKTASIEKQQQLDLQAKQTQQQADLDAKQAEQQAITNRNNIIANEKANCATQAEQQAQDQYKLTCTYDCHTGYYYTANKDSYYNTCLQENGLN